MLTQIFHVTLATLRSLRFRLGMVLVMTVGISCVTGVIASMLALAGGLIATLESTPREDRVLVLADTAQFISESSLSADHVSTILSAPGVARSAAGAPAVSADVRSFVTLRGGEDDVLKGTVVYGLSPAGLTIRPEIHLTEGRAFEPGLFEAIVGKHARQQFKHADIGDRLLLETTELDIVGEFESGDWLESGFLTDATTLLTALGRTSPNAVLVQLEHPSRLSIFRDALAQSAVLEFQVLTEAAYYERVARSFSFYEQIVGFVGIVVALGGVICVLNVCYGAVHQRQPEIVTYRALGFDDAAIVISVLAESTVIAVGAALLGTLVVWLTFDGATITTGARDASVVHVLEVSSDVLTTSVLCAIAIALLGSLFPAIKATRLPVTALTHRGLR